MHVNLASLLPLDRPTIFTLHQGFKQINAEIIAVYFAALLGRRLRELPGP
jgi:hypothetical protein